jgi:polyphosphate kinase
VASLIRASKAGKQVTVVVELQARFDERTNIAWARVLEEAGVQVIYGLATLKTHAKLCLVVRREAADVRRYCHIGTGNYNADTARAYEDLGLFTSDPDIGSDVGELFNLLSGSGEPPRFRRLMVSPLTARSGLLDAIDAERRAGPDGRIVIKTNGLTDPAMIDALYRASQAGASVDLVVRGRCCLRPGVPGLSEGIRVRSIVGRYLEHSRVFCFGGPAGRPVRVALGSADLMERNLDRRVEVVVPVDDPTLQRRVAGLLDWALLDQATSWELGPDGRWVRTAPDLPPHSLGLSLQAQFQMQALAARRTRLDASPRAARRREAAPASVPEAPIGRPSPPPGSAPAPSPPAPLATERPSVDPWWRRWALRLR